MKMKEVISITGLTDRAVRLYISNGLVSPSNEQSYSGRSNIDFSEDDVELLKKIALLRKADFSISQIKSIISGGDEAKSALADFVAQKTEEQETISAALHALESVEGASLDSICEKLTAEFEQQSVPEEDMKASKAERTETRIFRIISIVGIALTVLFDAFMLAMYPLDYRFLCYKPAWGDIIATAIVLVPVIVLGIILLMYRKPRINEKRQRLRRTCATVMVFVLIFAEMALLPLQTVILAWCYDVYSFTDKPKNYMELDKYTEVYADDLYRVFPAVIPREVRYNESKTDSTKYYYKYQDCIDPWFDIAAEWQLSDESFNAEVARITAMSDNITQKGDWTCVFLSENGEEQIGWHSYYILMFAYNDSTDTVRYIAAYSMDTAGSQTPYYLELEW